MSIKDFPTIKKKECRWTSPTRSTPCPGIALGGPWKIIRSLPIYGASFGPTYRIDSSNTGTTIWFLLPGLCSAGFRRDQSWAPTCGTSGTMLCSEKFSFLQVATSFVTRTTGSSLLGGTGGKRKAWPTRPRHRAPHQGPWFKAGSGVPEDEGHIVS